MPEPTLATPPLAAFSAGDLPPDFVDLTQERAFDIDLRYATANNFVGRVVYGGFDRLILHRIAADKLRAAATLLAVRRPAMRLLVLDGLRPNRVQRVFWEMVRGTPQQKYVGDPAIGSVHGFGLAVDVTLSTGGVECDMGTPFDGFDALSEPAREVDFLASGALAATQMANRLLLRQVMQEAGFLAIAEEWWHFDALAPSDVRRDFSLIE